MKELLVIRHAKSSWANPGQDDFDRPLNERGHKDAAEMAKQLVKKGIKIDRFISSPAVRALTTAEYFARAFHQKPAAIVQAKELYLAPASVYDKVIKAIPNELNTVAVFAHNPGITDFVQGTETARIDNMPTCAIFGIRLHTNDWAKVRTCAKEFWFFDYPKLH
ncbi:MAG TPA: histidine phosphatase family protein [Sediminibacterium sp.]|nr:histidine phosphatase family protein [Sediminibacterium sp.]